MTSDQLQMFDAGTQPDGRANKTLPQPPILRCVCSVSCSMAAQEFFPLLVKNEVTLIVDSRLSPVYDGARWSDGRDLPYIAKLHGIEYFHAVELAPTKDMRERFDVEFKSVRKAEDRNPKAWTEFLRAYERRMMELRVLQNTEVKSVLNGSHASIAIICACRHHDDCHRSFTTGLIATYVEGVSLKILYPDGEVPKPSSPRRYRHEDFPHANLRMNAPTTKRVER